VHRLHSLLIVSGDRPDRFGKAVAAGTDAIGLDFEDAFIDTLAAFDIAGACRKPGAPGAYVLVRRCGLGTAEAP
jgi:Lipoate-protein ligase B